MTEDLPDFFFKFGSKKNILDLYENGTIYFNSIDYFQRLEEQGLRGDNYEGTTNITNLHENDKYKLKIIIPETDEEKSINLSKFHQREFLQEIKGNLYSLYSLREKDIIGIDNFKVDKKTKEFGSHFIIIKNTSKFIELICTELKKNRLEYCAKHVEYYEKERINGDISLFHKSMEFEYQKEFRIILYNREIEPKIIQIGSLKDYADVFHVDA